jgi:hypothetical protein
LLDYLSTDELLSKIRLQETSSIKINNQIGKPKKRVQIRRVFKVLFIFMVTIAFLHITYLLLQLATSDRGLSLFGRATILAATIDQDIEIVDDQFEVAAKVVIMRKFNPSQLDNGDYVIIYGKFGSDFYWIERVISFDLEKAELTTSVDGFFASDDITSFDQVIGFYVKDASLSGTINYTSSTTRGFLITLMTYTLILYVLYYAYRAEEKRFNKKINKNSL